MIRSTIIFFIMVILFLGGVIIGFDQAGEGMDKVSGNKDSTYDAVQINKNDEDEYDVEVLGEPVSSEQSLEDKKEEYEQIRDDFITEKIAITVEKGVQWFFNLIVEGAYKISQIFYA